jgi:squalene-hopene/tetraprenyl-beta-curcumene cyclase
MSRFRLLIPSVSLALSLSIALASVARAAATTQPSSPADNAEVTIEKALVYLKAHENADFSWQTGSDPPAISALVLKAFLQSPHYDPKNPFLDKGFGKLLSYQKPDGSISADLLATYNTAIAISALAKDGAYKDQLDKAVKYLRDLQWTDKIEGLPFESKKVDPSDPNYGGFGYGRQGRADMSNGNFALDALKDAGMKSDDPAFQAALKFATRSQNNSETNDQKWATDDGGFVYFPADGGGSAAGEYVGPDGRKLLRSYGSMTYAGLKSMMYAGLSKDDPRVKAAWKWIGNNWTLTENPGMAANDAKAAVSGLFYYYHTLARALRAYGEPIITDPKGVKHDWRLELIDALHAAQNTDGSFSGTQRWMEGKPVLATALGVLSLQEAQADLKEHPPKSE